MKNTFFLLVTVSLMMVGLSTIFAQGFGNKNFDRHEQILQLLNLTETQLTKFNDFRFAHQEAIIDMRANLQKNRLDIEKYMSGNNISKAKLLSLTDKQSKAYSSMNNSRINMWFDVYNILDADQKVVWKKHFIRMGTKHGKMARHGKMGIHGNHFNGKKFEKGLNKFN